MPDDETIAPGAGTLEKEVNSAETGRARRINSLTDKVNKMVAEENKKRLQISTEIDSLAKQHQKAMKELEMSRSEFTTETTSSLNRVVKGLGSAVGALSTGIARISADTAKASREAISQYGRAISQDISINKTNTIAMALSQATPLFGYFAAKFMETDVFRKASIKIQDSVASSVKKGLSVVSAPFRREKPKPGGGPRYEEISTGASKARISAASIVTQQNIGRTLEKIDKFSENFGTNLETTLIEEVKEQRVSQQSMFKTFIKNFIHARDVKEEKWNMRLTKAILDLRVGLIGLSSRFNIAWKKTLLSHPTFRTILTVSDMMWRFFSVPVGGILRARGGYQGPLNRAMRTKNVMMKSANVLGLIYSTGIPLLDEIRQSTTYLADYFSKGTFETKLKKSWTIAGKLYRGTKAGMKFAGEAGEGIGEYLRSEFKERKGMEPREALRRKAFEMKERIAKSRLGRSWLGRTMRGYQREQGWQDYPGAPPVRPSGYLGAGGAPAGLLGEGAIRMGSGKTVLSRSSGRTAEQTASYMKRTGKTVTDIARENVMKQGAMYEGRSAFSKGGPARSPEGTIESFNTQSRMQEEVRNLLQQLVEMKQDQEKREGPHSPSMAKNIANLAVDSKENIEKEEEISSKGKKKSESIERKAKSAKHKELKKESFLKKYRKKAMRLNQKRTRFMGKMSKRLKSVGSWLWKGVLFLFSFVKPFFKSLGPALKWIGMLSSGGIAGLIAAAGGLTFVIGIITAALTGLGIGTLVNRWLNRAYDKWEKQKEERGRKYSATEADRWKEIQEEKKTGGFKTKMLAKAKTQTYLSLTRTRPEAEKKTFTSSITRYGLSWLDANAGQQAYMKSNMDKYLQYRPSEITSLRSQWIAEGGPPWYLGSGIENSYEYGERREKRFLKYLQKKGMKVGKAGAIADVIGRDIKIKAQQVKIKAQRAAKFIKEKAITFLTATARQAKLRALQLTAFGADRGVWLANKLSEVRIKGKWFDIKNLDTGKYEKKFKELKKKAEKEIKIMKMSEKVRIERAKVLASYGAEGGDWVNGKLKRIKINGKWIEVKEGTKITSLTKEELDELRKWKKTHRPPTPKKPKEVVDPYLYNKLGEIVGTKPGAEYKREKGMSGAGGSFNVEGLKPGESYTKGKTTSTKMTEAMVAQSRRRRTWKEKARQKMKEKAAEVKSYGGTRGRWRFGQLREVYVDGQWKNVKSLEQTGVTSMKDLAGRDARNKMIEASTTGKMIDKTNKKLTDAMGKDQGKMVNAIVQNVSNTMLSSNNNSQTRAVVGGGGGGGGGAAGTASSGGNSVASVVHCNVE